MLIQWDDRFATGHPEVDAQHQRLFALAASVHEAMAAGRLGDIQAHALELLSRYCAEHFADEERLMRESGYPRYAEHKRQHDGLAGRTAVIVKAFKVGRTTAGESFPEFLARWLQHHILEEDLLLVRFLGEAGETAAKTG